MIVNPYNQYIFKDKLIYFAFFLYSTGRKRNKILEFFTDGMWDNLRYR